MKRTYFIILSALIIATTTSAFMVKDANGKASYSGAPGDFGTCTSCHGGGAGPTTVSISTIPSLDPGNIYTPGNTYTINIDVANSNFSSFGFDAVVISGSVSTSGNSGVLSLPGTGVKLVNGTAGRKNATHTAPKAGTGIATFSFVWTAPVSSTMTAIYATGNAVNGNGSTSGDAVGTGNLMMYPSSATGIDQNVAVVNGLGIFPNPASNQLNVRYNLNASSNIVIALYSINGELATKLIEENQDPGVYSKTIQLPATLASGMYFMKVVANNNITAQRLVSIK